MLYQSVDFQDLVSARIAAQTDKCNFDMVGRGEIGKFSAHSAVLDLGSALADSVDEDT